MRGNEWQSKYIFTKVLVRTTIVYKIWTNYPLRPRIMILVKLGTTRNKNHIVSINKQTILQENNFFYHFIRFFENIKIINSFSKYQLKLSQEPFS